ncbi:hypothetical protein JCM10212_003217 [Sporobolomyces blumeae]
MAPSASTPAAAPPPFLEPMPRTLLPSDPTLLAQFIRNQHLAALRSLYEYKTDQVAKDVAAQYDATRGRNGRARRRRGSSPIGGTVDEAERDRIDQSDLLEVRKRLKWDPAVEGASHPRDVESSTSAHDARGGRSGDAAAVVHGTAEQLSTVSQEARRSHAAVSIDRAHAYDLVYDVSPDHCADAFWHGPAPPPPARVIRTVLRATREAPFVDPEDLSTAQLEALARPMWEQAGKAVCVHFGEARSGPGRKPPTPPVSLAQWSAEPDTTSPYLTREEQRIQKEMNLDEMAEWEERVIAGFSATCHERIGTLSGPKGRNVGSAATADGQAREAEFAEAQSGSARTSLSLQSGIAGGGGAGMNGATGPLGATPLTPTHAHFLQGPAATASTAHGPTHPGHLNAPPPPPPQSNHPLSHGAHPQSHLSSHQHPHSHAHPHAHSAHSHAQHASPYPLQHSHYPPQQQQQPTSASSSSSAHAHPHPHAHPHAHSHPHPHSHAHAHQHTAHSHHAAHGYRPAAAANEAYGSNSTGSAGAGQGAAGGGGGEGGGGGGDKKWR